MSSLTAFVVTIPGLDFKIPTEILITGLITGLIYGLLGIGLTLIYKSTKVINFAHGETGAIAAAVMVWISVDLGMPYGLGILAALGTAIVVGALMEFLVIRRLSEAPRLIVLVATIAAAQVITVVNGLVPRPDVFSGAVFPTPFTAEVKVGGVFLHAPELLMLIVVPALTIGLTLFLTKSKMGLGARAAAENLRASRLAGVPARRVSMTIWIIAAILSAASAILVGPSRSIVSGGGGLGPDLLVRALAAAMIGGLTNIPQVFIGGLAVGVIEALVLFNYPTSGLLELVIFAVIAVSIFFRKDLGRLARGKEEAGVSLGGSVAPLEPKLARLPQVRLAKFLSIGILIGAALIFSRTLDSGEMLVFSSICLFAVMGLSVTVLTGFTGQVSLGQFAFVGIGAIVGGRLVYADVPIIGAILLTMVVGGMVALLVGLPGLRVKGSFLAVTTLAFAVAAGGWLLRQRWLVVEENGQTSMRLPRGKWFGLDLAPEEHYFWVCLALLVVVAVLVAHLRTTGFGRSLLAVRDNENAAAAMSIPPRKIKLLGFVLSGAIASLGGYFYGGLLVSFASANLFSPTDSLALVAMVIFGGVTTVTGTIIGALWVRGIPFFFGDRAGILSSGIGVLLVLQMLPGGLARLLFDIRDKVVKMIVPKELTEKVQTSDDVLTARPPLPPAVVDEANLVPVPLRAVDITVQFGGLTAVSHVDFEARQGEVVGLVGQNGAGKTTLFNALTGALKPTTGQVFFNEQDISGLRPEERAKLGIGRSFQEARLYPEVPLIDTFKLALERAHRSGVASSLLGLPNSRAKEKRKQERADEILELLGLTRFAYRNCGELSTGTRRFAELGCCVAMEAKLLLLDEPAAGFAQREVEAFTPVLREIRAHLGATMVVIDHDVPMMLGLVDRLYVMSVGEVIAEGDPQECAANPEVIAAYLGTDERAIHRSGTGAGELAGASTAAAGESGSSDA